MNFNWFWKFGAKESSTSRRSDYSHSYEVVDCTKYGLKVEEFIERYPYVTVETDGEVKPETIFGDEMEEKFGTLKFASQNFNHEKYHNEYIVAAHKNDSTLDVGAEIGLGFGNEDNKLYLRPFLNGWIYSVGHHAKYLEFGLRVDSITFHPKEELSSH